MKGQDTTEVPALSAEMKMQLHMDQVIKLKAEIFDFIVKIETHQVAINGLIGEKDSLLVQLNELQNENK